MTLTQEMTSLINGLSVTTKGPNIQLEDELKDTNKAKTPLTLDEMRELLLTNTPIPEGKTVPVGLGMQDYASLPGGMAAYTGYISQMDAIKSTAGFGKGAGGTTPQDPIEDNPIEANCPDGYIFDSIKLKCVPESIIPDLEGNEGGNTSSDEASLVSSYHSFAETIMQNDGYKNSGGTLQDFYDNMDDWWAGGVSKYLYTDMDLLASAFYANAAKGLGVGANALGTSNEGYFDTGAIQDPPSMEDIVGGTETNIDILGRPTGPVYQGQTLNQYQPPSVDDTSPVTPSRPGISSPMPVAPVPSVSIQSGDPQPAPTVKPATVTQADIKQGETARPKAGEGSLAAAQKAAQDKANAEQRRKDEAERRRDEAEANRAAAQKAREQTKSAQEKVRGFSGGYGFQEGGFVEQTKPLQLDDVSLKMQEGGPVEGMPMNEAIPTEGMESMPMPSGQPAGFIEDPSAAPAPDTPVDAMQGEGQKDDVMGELPEGTFVINAMAVQLAGIDELEKMVEDAYEKMVELLKEKQVDEPLIRQLVDRSKSVGKVDVAVSNGEFIIPPELVPIIGEDKLRKINDRGLRKLEETKKTREKQQPPAQMNQGGRVIATEPDGKILTEKVKDASGREVSRILFKDEVKAPEDKGQPSDTFDSPVKDISESKSFVRRKGVDEYIEKDPRQMDRQGFSVTTPKDPKFGGGEDQLASDLGTPTFGGGEGQLAPTRRTYTGGEGPKELTQGFIRPTGTGLETGDPQPITTPTTPTITKPEYEDPEEVRDSATYVKKPSRPLRTSEFSEKANMPERLGYSMQNRLYGNAFAGPVVENEVSVQDGIDLVNKLYKEGNRDKLLEIAIDQDSVYFSFPNVVKAKARDLAFDLGSGKADGPLKDILTATSDSALVHGQSSGMVDDRSLSEGQSSLTGFVSSPRVPAPPPPNAGDFDEKENVPDRFGDLEQRLYNKSFVEPKPTKDQTMQNVQKAEDLIAQQYQDADLGNLAEEGDRTEVIPTDELTEELMKMNSSELNSMLQPDVYNEYSTEDRKKITQEFMRRMTVSSRFREFDVQPRRVSLFQEPRNADDLTRREGDFPETIDTRDGVILNQLYMRLVDKESKFKLNARSNKGAIGLSQLMPATIKDPGAGLIQLLPENERQYIDPRIVGDKPLTDPNANLLFGYYYLKALLTRYQGDVAKALSAYNYGLGNTDNLIEKHGNEWTDNLPDETEDYIRTIKGYLRPADIALPKSRPQQVRVGGFV